MVNKSTKKRLLEIVSQCDTQREAALLLNSNEQYIQRLTKELGITKWRQNNRVHVREKTETRICGECGEVFERRLINKNPGRFCSKKCQGKWLGRNHGFRKNKENRKDLRKDKRIINDSGTKICL